MEARLNALYELGQKLILLRDARKVAETVLEIAARVLDFQDSDFLLVDEVHNQLYVAARKGQLQGAEGLRLCLDGDMGVTVRAARSGEPVYVPDVRQEPCYVYTGFSAASEFAIPIKFEERVLGVFNVENDQVDAFSQADRELLTMLANQAALALENARLYAQERHRIEELAAVNRLAGHIGATLDLRDTLDSIARAAAELVPCSLAEISLWDKSRQMLVLQALQCTPERAVPVGQSYPPGTGYTGWVVRNKRSLLVPDVEARTDIRPHLLPGELPFKAYVGLPLLRGEALIGTLVLVHDHPGSFDENDLQLLEALGGQAATAIHNARLYEELARRHQDLEALYSVAEAVNCPLDLDRTLEEGLKQALSVTGLEMGAIALLDSSFNTLVLHTQLGMPANFLGWLKGKMAQEPLVDWPHGGYFLVREISPDSPDIPVQVLEEGIRLTADVPLFAEGELVGILTVATPRIQSFSPEERSLLQSIGLQLGTAIANARLRQEALTAERLAAIGRVATSVAHDLRSPLGGILRSAEFLARPELSANTREKLSQAIVSLAHRLINTSQQILDYVQKERLPLRRTPCRLSEFLDDVLAVLEVDFCDRGIEVSRRCRYRGEVLMDADRMAQVIYNIATNARDAMPNGGKFYVSTRQVGDDVEMRFCDTGPGVPEGLGDRIFEPFFTYGKRQGAGLGLAIARRIVDEHGGTIRLESGAKQGAAFIVSLPL